MQKLSTNQNKKKTVKNTRT